MRIASEIDALEQNLWSQWAQFGVPQDCNFRKDSGVWQLETPITAPPYNGIFRFDVSETDADSRIDHAIGTFESRNFDHFWLVHPTACPGDLNNRLETRGFSEFVACPGMVLEPGYLSEDIPYPEDIEVREITPAEETPFLTLLADRWGIPDGSTYLLQSFFRDNRVAQAGSASRGWLATLKGVPVGKALTHRSGNIVGLYHVATRPEARGRGIGLALCAQALRETADAGIDLLVLHSTPIAVGLYKWLGFREVAPFRLFARGTNFTL